MMNTVCCKLLSLYILQKRKNKPGMIASRNGKSELGVFYV